MGYPKTGTNLPAFGSESSLAPFFCVSFFCVSTLSYSLTSGLAKGIRTATATPTIVLGQFFILILGRNNFLKGQGWGKKVQLLLLAKLVLYKPLAS